MLLVSHIFCQLLKCTCVTVRCFDAGQKINGEKKKTIITGDCELSNFKRSQGAGTDLNFNQPE